MSQPRERDALERFVAVRVFGRLGLEKLAPRRGVEVEVAHFDRRAGAERRRHRRGKLGSFGGDRPRVPLARDAARERQARDRSDARERFAAEAETRDALEIGERLDLARRVARECELKLFARDAAPVVAHSKELHAARLEVHRNRARARVEAVLEQLLQRGGRSIDDFARGDLVGEKLGQHLDRRHAEL